MKDNLLKIIPDFFMYYIGQKDYNGEKLDIYNPIEEYDNINEFIVNTLEHEVELYKDWKKEGFEDKQKISYINKENIKEIKRIIKKYYRG